MKHKLLLLFLFIFTLGTFAGCGSGQDLVSSSTGLNPNGASTTNDSVDEDAAATGPARQVEAQIILPSGVNLDFSSLTTMSQLFTAEVESNGNTLVALDEGGRVLAIVFDSNDEPVMVGFITDDRTEISVKTTVQASLYVKMGTFLLPYEIRQIFWENVESFPGFSDLVSQTEELYRNDPLFFKSTAYRDLIIAYIDSTTNGNLVNPRLLTDGGIKSGLQVREAGGDAVLMVNNFRRRTHAFVYKLDYTDSGDAKHQLINESQFANDSTLPASQDFIVKPAAGLTGTIGAFQNIVAGKGIEYFAVESGPVDFSLAPEEKEAHYSIRVVGPASTPTGLTKTEAEKVTRLEVETLALDYFLPAVLMIIGQDNDEVAGLNGLPSAPEALITAMQAILDAAPEAAEASKEGHYEYAVRGILEKLFDSGTSLLYEAAMKAALDLLSTGLDRAGKGFSQDSAQRILGSTGKFFKALEALDILMQGADWARITSAVASSKMVEDFRIEVTENKVTLTPPFTIVMEGGRKSIKAVIQDGAATLGGGEAFVYRWSTTGAYGRLKDNVGNSGTSFESSRDTVEYIANNSTPPDDAIDEVTCEVIIRGPGPDVPVGESKPGEVWVRERGFEIFPQELEVEGGNIVRLGVRHTDWTNPLDSNVFAYEFVWDTPGEFGLFDGTTKNFSSSTTNRVNYECLEEEDEGSETVSVTIYSRFKDENGPFQWSDSISDTIKVVNDPNKMIFYVGNETISGTSDGAVYHQAYVHTVYQTAPIPGALKYVITCVDQVPDSRSSYVGTGTSYNATDPTTDGFYRHTTSRASVSTPFPDRRDDWLADRLAVQSAYQGMAKVVVTLAP